MIRRASAALLLLAACAGGGRNSEPRAAPDIIGTVEERTGAADEISLLIVQDSTRSAGYPRARVRVTRETRVLRREGDANVASTPADLVVGARLEAWFTGPVMESDPVQATAARVVRVR